MGTPQEFRDLLGEFVRSSRRMLVHLEETDPRQQIPEVERTAHTLKSMAHLVGAFELEKICRDIERNARERQVVSDVVQVLSREVEQANGVVQRFLR